MDALILALNLKIRSIVVNQKPGFSDKPGLLNASQLDWQASINAGSMTLDLLF